MADELLTQEDLDEQTEDRLEVCDNEPCSCCSDCHAPEALTNHLDWDCGEEGFEDGEILEGDGDVAQPTYDLVLNGGFDDEDDHWTHDPEWYDFTAGWAELLDPGTGGTYDLYQDIAGLVAGEQYVLTFFWSTIHGSGDVLNVYLGGDLVGTITTDGAHTLTVTAGSSDTNLLFSANVPKDWQGFITTISLVNTIPPILDIVLPFHICRCEDPLLQYASVWFESDVAYPYTAVLTDHLGNVIAPTTLLTIPVGGEDITLTITPTAYFTAPPAMTTTLSLPGTYLSRLVLQRFAEVVTLPAIPRSLPLPQHEAIKYVEITLV